MIINAASDLIETMQWTKEKKDLFAEKNSELVFELSPELHETIPKAAKIIKK